jgi:hypothetical protein
VKRLQLLQPSSALLLFTDYSTGGLLAQLPSSQLVNESEQSFIFLHARWIRSTIIRVGSMIAC